VTINIPVKNPATILAPTIAPTANATARSPQKDWLKKAFLPALRYPYFLTSSPLGCDKDDDGDVDGGDEDECVNDCRKDGSFFLVTPPEVTVVLK